MTIRHAVALGLSLLLAACGDSGAAGPDAGAIDVDAGAGIVDAGPALPDAEPECLFVPTGEFNPEIECAWSAPAEGSAYPELDDVVSTPVVVNLTDDDDDGDVDLDDIPDIAFIAYGLQASPCPAGAVCKCCNASGVLRVVSGSCTDGTLAEHYTVGASEIEADIGVPGIWLDNSGGLAAGDIDADGSVDLVATTLLGGTIAFERDGRVKWYQPDYPVGEDHLAGSQPALADVDSDGKPEVIQGRVVLNGEDGSLQWRGTAGLGTNGFMGPVSALGDLDLNGQLNVLAGGTVYESSGAELWTHAFPTPISSDNCQSQGYPCDGFTATGNFDGDDEGELVVARAGEVAILNHDGTLLSVDGIEASIQIPVDDCGKNEGGPPTVADFDGDGEAEIGVAGADYYVVVDLECLTSTLPDHCDSVGIRWKVANFDCSSRVTGSSVFDFDGDGSAEVVYNDEKNFRILRGTDGEELISIPNHSHTRLEMPIVADVDNDGNAEIVFIENASGGGPSQGIRVWGDAGDSWVATRRIWNQHGYHVTNVTELGAIPTHEPVNWLEPTEATEAGVMNNFRQNLPEYNVFAAPDLTVGLDYDDVACELVAKICNDGSANVGAGVPVTFYDNTTGAELVCANAPVVTQAPMAPGACELVHCTLPELPAGPIDVRACVDNEGYDCATGGANNECDEDDNLADLQTVLDCVPIP